MSSLLGHKFSCAIRNSCKFGNSVKFVLAATIAILAFSNSALGQPPNDNWFTGTVDAGAFPISLTGNNVDATVEPGELELGTTGATAWWFFDAPADGLVTIDTFGSDYDTQLHIFDGFVNGATVADLNPITNNDDAGGMLQSELTFAVTAGDRYEIRVGGFDGDGGGNGNPASQGAITLNGTFEPTVPLEEFPESFTRERGVLVAGSLADVQASDDDRLRFNPGFTLNSFEAPVWIRFESTLVVGQQYGFNIESQTSTPGLTYTVEAFNYITGSNDVLGTSPESFNSDSVNTFFMTSQHVGSKGEGQARVGWRQTSFTLLFPWEVRIDAVSWTPVSF